MSTLSLMDMVKLTFKAMVFKYEQNKLTTSENAVVTTPKGAVKGVKRISIWNDEYFSFERIPFAKPPLGELRFRAPQPNEPWDTILDCTYAAEKPLQSNVVFKKYKGSEDCLYLNVFTKSLKPEKLLPVMVWIYGGGFQIGEATRDLYSPDFFMSKDIVLVTVAYRLGAFGFLSMEDPAVNVPGNAGIKDQIMGLKWVQENIALFGGDPQNVTVFGESAGGASAHLCMLTKQSKGLIHKGIVMSGSALCPWVCAPPSTRPYRLAKAMGYDGAEQDSDVYRFLAECKGPDIVLASANVLTRDEKHHRIQLPFVPVVEPYKTEQAIITERPFDVLKTTWSNELPMMIGGTSFEGLLFHPEVTRRPATLDEAKSCKNLLPPDLSISEDSKEADEFALQLQKAYFNGKNCSRETMMEFLELQTYREFWHPIYRTALARLHYSQAPTYMYRFDFDSRDGNAIRNILCGRETRGTCHGDDLCYLFRAIFSVRPQAESLEERVTRAMIDIWTSFAANSDPNCEAIKELQFEALKNNEDFMCLNIADKIEFKKLPELEKLEIWNGFYKPQELFTGEHKWYKQKVHSNDDKEGEKQSKL